MQAPGGLQGRGGDPGQQLRGWQRKTVLRLQARIPKPAQQLEEIYLSSKASRARPCRQAAP